MKTSFKVYLVVGLLGVVTFFAACSNDKGGNATSTSPTAGNGIKIAYVNIDSLESHYELLKKRREDFKSRQEQMERELQQSYQQIQGKSEYFQQKAQTMTQSELQEAEKQLMMMQQSLEGRRQSLTEQLAKEQEVFNKELKKQLDSFLISYNKDKMYDYILSYSASGGSVVMYANNKYDITNDVIAGMNAIAKKSEGNKK